jgi:hypothetical protein
MPTAATAVTLRLVARRGPAGGLGIDVGEANNVVGLSSGGQASSDGLLCVGDAIVAVDGEPLRGRKLSSVITPGRDAYQLTVKRADKGLLAQFAALGLPAAGCVWRLFAAQVRRGEEGLGLHLNGSLVTDVADTAAEDGMLRAGDVIAAVDGKAVGAGTLGALVAPGQKTYEMLVLRREGAAAAPPAAPEAAAEAAEIDREKIAALLSEATAAAQRLEAGDGDADAPPADAATGGVEALVPASPSKAAPVVLLSDEGGKAPAAAASPKAAAASPKVPLPAGDGGGGVYDESRGIWSDQRHLPPQYDERRGIWSDVPTTHGGSYTGGVYDERRGVWSDVPAPGPRRANV